FLIARVFAAGFCMGGGSAPPGWSCRRGLCAGTLVGKGSGLLPKRTRTSALRGELGFEFGAVVFEDLVGGVGGGDALAVVGFDEDEVEGAVFEHAGEVAFAGADGEGFG